MPGESVPLERVNQQILAQHGLLDSGLASLDQVISRVFGLYGSAPTCYLSVLTRSAAFRFEELDQALCGRAQPPRPATLVRVRAMRATVFAVPATLLPVVFQATHQAAERVFRTMIEKLGIDRRTYDRAAGRILDAIAGRELTVKEIRDAAAPLDDVVARSLNYVVAGLCADGRLVRARVRGGWTSNQHAYAKLDEWVPGIDLRSTDPASARATLARLYLESWGPATAADFQWWSGMKRTEADAALRAIASETQAIRIDGLPDGYLALTHQATALLDPPVAARRRAHRRTATAQPRAAALLPVWDAYTMAYEQRARYIESRWAPYVWDRGGNATSTVLLKGRIAGVWDFELDRALVLKVTLFEEAGPPVWRAIAREAERLAGAIDARDIELRDCGAPPTLAGAPQNRFLSPLQPVKGKPIRA